MIGTDTDLRMPQPDRALAARGARRGARGAAMAVALLVALLAGWGWLYALRGLGWLGSGPEVHDALPLLQLAGFDIQPLPRVVAAWLPAGVVAGVALLRLSRPRRALLAGLVGTAVLLIASQAAFALTRNLRLSDVLWSRAPGWGPWLEGLLFAVGCALPGRLPSGNRLTGRLSGVRRRRLDGARDLGLRAGQHRDAREHQRDGKEVDEGDRWGVPE